MDNEFIEMAEQIRESMNTKKDITTVEKKTSKITIKIASGSSESRAISIT